VTGAELLITLALKRRARINQREIDIEENSFEQN